MTLALTLPLLVSTVALKLNRNDSPIRVNVMFWPILRAFTRSNDMPKDESHLGLMR